MKPPKPTGKLHHHPGHHWGSFANDPWRDDLDPVTGEAWEQAVRVSRSHARPKAKNLDPHGGIEEPRTGDRDADGDV